MVRRELDRQQLFYNPISENYEALFQSRLLDIQQLGMLLPAVIALQVTSKCILSLLAKSGNEISRVQHLALLQLASPTGFS